LKAKSILGLTVLFMLACLIISVQAQWPALNSGFAITTDYHGADPIPPGTAVTAKAGFIPEKAGISVDDIEYIQFIWHSEGGVEFDVDVYPSPDWLTEPWTDGSGNTWTVYYLTNTQYPTTAGEWGVQAVFRGEGGSVQGLDEEIPAFAIRATSYEVVPEVPLGTITALLAMVAAGALFVAKKRYTYR